MNRRAFVIGNDSDCYCVIRNLNLCIEISSKRKYSSSTLKVKIEALKKLDKRVVVTKISIEFGVGKGTKGKK